MRPRVPEASPGTPGHRYGPQGNTGSPRPRSLWAVAWLNTDHISQCWLESFFGEGGRWGGAAYRSYKKTVRFFLIL